MPLYRQPKSPYWWVRFSVGGVKVRRSSQTSDRSAAQEFETQLRSDLWRQVKLGERPRYTFDEAIKRWFAEADNRGRDRDRERLRWFEEYLNGTALVDITRETIEKLRVVKTSESSASTANRHMALLRMLLRKAWREWDWIDKAPVVPMYRIERAEPRFLTRAQYVSLRKKLPKHLVPLADFSIETGLRMRNATGLTWSQVDLRRRLVIVPASSSKSGATIAVPLSLGAIAVLRKQRRRHQRVFLFRGEPYDDANGAAFKAAARAAGVPWLRWHDLRHTWASWHIQHGTNLLHLQELGGWKSHEMVRRYAHLNPAHLRFHVEHGQGIPARAGR